MDSLEKGCLNQYQRPLSNNLSNKVLNLDLYVEYEHLFKSKKKLQFCNDHDLYPITLVFDQNIAWYDLDIGKIDLRGKYQGQCSVDLDSMYSTLTLILSRRRFNSMLSLPAQPTQKLFPK